MRLLLEAAEPATAAEAQDQVIKELGLNSAGEEGPAKKVMHNNRELLSVCSTHLSWTAF
jgi:hypothetical protein